MGLALCGVGRYADAIAVLTEELELCRRIGERFWASRTLNTLGWVYYDICNVERAMAYNREALDLSLELGDQEVIRNAQLNLADCVLAAGEAAEALTLLREVEAAIAADTDPRDEWMKWRYRQHLEASLAQTLIATGDPEAALPYADRCIEAANATGARRNVVKGRCARAVALAALERGDEAMADIERAVELAREITNPAQRWRSMAVLAAVLHARGEIAGAAAAAAEALELAESVAEALPDHDLRATMLGAPEIARLREPAPR
jgi:tetratricopeptide (TPR) repeat protein